MNRRRHPQSMIESILVLAALLVMLVSLMMLMPNARW